MTSGDVVRHSLLTFCGPLCLLRPLELGFGLSAPLRMFGHGCTYSGVPAGSEKENRDSVGHLRSAQAGGQGENSFYLVLHSSCPSRGKYSYRKSVQGTRTPVFAVRGQDPPRTLLEQL